MQEFVESGKMVKSTDIEMAEAAVGIYMKLETGIPGKRTGSDRTPRGRFKKRFHHFRNKSRDIEFLSGSQPWNFRARIL